MPSIAENLQSWNNDYGWPRQGEEWSQAWGGSEAQWFGSILPRIQRLLPARRVLEIGPGFGRWTHYLREHCDALVGVDLAQRCVDACRERFAGDARLAFHVNDGTSLGMVPDGSIDLVFSFDTLVHAESEVIEAYLAQVRAKLAPGGRGFVHHSNFGAYCGGFDTARATPAALRPVLFRKDFLGPDHWRARSMTASIFELMCERAGLRCVTQELVTWGTESIMIDCFSVFTAAGPAGAAANRVIENPEFMKEADIVKRRAATYSAIALPA
jgi:SAM-dependent methyltransferase